MQDMFASPNLKGGGRIPDMPALESAPVTVNVVVITYSHRTHCCSPDKYAYNQEEKDYVLI